MKDALRMAEIQLSTSTLTLIILKQGGAIDWSWLAVWIPALVTLPIVLVSVLLEEQTEP